MGKQFDDLDLSLSHSNHQKKKRGILRLTQIIMYDITLDNFIHLQMYPGISLFHSYDSMVVLHYTPIFGGVKSTTFCIHLDWLCLPRLEMANGCADEAEPWRILAT
jgi:hypothetical protein